MSVCKALAVSLVFASLPVMRSFKGRSIGSWTSGSCSRARADPATDAPVPLFLWGLNFGKTLEGNP